MDGKSRNARDARIRAIRDDDLDDVLGIINAAAKVYRGVIPPDRWRDPYMRADELVSERADGVRFSGCEVGGRLVGVMGIQSRADVDLVRHAYVLPESQGSGIGSLLLRHLGQACQRSILIGTWRAAEWAIRFYEAKGFIRVSDEDAAALLRTYWTVPDEQIAASVVLASCPLAPDFLEKIIAAAAATSNRPASSEP